MEIEQVVKYLSEGRIVDLTLKMNPGSTEGPSAKPSRRYEIDMFQYEPWKGWSGPGETMYQVEMCNHISTHAEGPSHYIPVRYGRSAPDLSEVPLSSFFGSAVLIDCKDLGPKTPIDAEVLRKFPIHENDIVLVGKGQHIGSGGEERSFLMKEGAEYLFGKKIKLVGFDDTVIPEDPSIRDLKSMYTHDLMLSNGILIIERLANLEKLTKTRFLFFAFPPNLGGLDSFPIRAIAIEDRD